MMGHRKKPYTPKSFESTGVSNDTSANIYASMMESSAFKDLSKNQRLLYVYMKKQYYGTRKPERDFPDMPELQGNDVFYFSIGLAVRYGLYSKSNDRQFYNDVAAIERHGFIKTVSSGRATKSKSIYKFTGDWRLWNDSS